MLSVEQAESIILNLVRPLDRTEDVEVVDLASALGRVLAAPIKSELDFPFWDNSAMDGYAVRFDDVKDCTSEKPAILEIVEEIPAGSKPQKAIGSGQTARIFTGAMMPEGADTVVIQENTRREENRVKILASPQLKEYVRHKGSFYRAGTIMLAPGTIVDAPEIAVLATARCPRPRVYRRPVVAIFSTGDELITPDRPLQPGQVVDSNQPALAAIVAKDGAIPLEMGIVPDRPDEISRAITKAISSADMVLSTGGVSVGDYDYIDRVISALGGEIHINTIAIKPGKPLTVAKFTPECLYFGIPGNPASALVNYWRFIRGAIEKLSGRTGEWKPAFVNAKSRREMRSSGKLETYLWGKLHLVGGSYEFELAAGTHSSGNPIDLVRTNALAVIPAGQTLVSSGQEVKVMLV